MGECDVDELTQISTVHSEDVDSASCEILRVILKKDLPGGSTLSTHISIDTCACAGIQLVACFDVNAILKCRHTKCAGTYG